MGTLSRNRGITLVEVLTVIGILLILVLIIAATIPRSHERARRANCTNNMKQIGLGLLGYENQQKIFPGSAEVIKSDPQRPVGGWSFLFKILPNMEYDAIYDSIDPDLLKGTTTVPPSCVPLSIPGTGNSVGIARDTGIAEFLCPSNCNWAFELPSLPPNPPGKRHAVTNYKAMCSAFYSGFATNTATTQQYTGDVAVPEGTYPGLCQCDGGLYPTNDGIRLSDISDGASHTILCAETMDVYASSWIAGSDVNMVAIPYTAAEMQTDAANMAVDAKFKGGFWSPAGYLAKPGFESDGPMSNCITFFAFDYGPGGKNSCKTNPGYYPLDPYQAPCQLASSRIAPDVGWRYGPSSGHPTAINCFFGDGSVRPLRKDVDAAALFFAVTRANGDPPADDQL